MRANITQYGCEKNQELAREGLMIAKQKSFFVCSYPQTSRIMSCGFCSRAQIDKEAVLDLVDSAFETTRAKCASFISRGEDADMEVPKQTWPAAHNFRKTSEGGAYG
jgi:hypothetical protein